MSKAHPQISAMHAVRIHHFGGPEVLEFDILPKPEPGPGEVLIRVAGASVNPVDYKIRQGLYPAVKPADLPYTLGRDAAGKVVGLGEKAGGFQLGDMVFAMLPMDRGGYAEWVAAPAKLFAFVPENLSLHEAAAVPLAALTAWQGLIVHGGLRPGQRVLIHGASGGVGPFAVQFAALRGAQVFATASSDKQAFVQGLGAEQVFDAKQDRFEDQLSEIDLVFDMIGGEVEDRSWSVLKRGGRLVSTLQEPDAERAAAAGVSACRYTCQPDGEQLREIARLIEDGMVSVTLEKVFPLRRAAEAERHLEHDHVTGKVVLDLSHSPTIGRRR